jgi:hypothetical protein
VVSSVIFTQSHANGLIAPRTNHQQIVHREPALLGKFLCMALGTSQPCACVPGLTGVV